MLQRRRAGQQTTDETLDRLKFNVNRRLRSRSGVEEHLPLQELSQCLDSWKPEFVDWSSGRLLNLDDAMNMKQGIKELKLVDLFFKVVEDRWVNSPM